MLKYAMLGLLLSGIFSLEGGLGVLPLAGPLIPDLGLLVILAYACRGRGRVIASLCFLCGWLKGAQAAEPAGIYILAYLVIALVLFNSRSLFFTDRPWTQLLLSLFFALFYWILLAACRGLELLPDYSMERLKYQALSCATAACAAPLVFRAYDHLVFLRKMLHP